MDFINHIDISNLSLSTSETIALIIFCFAFATQLFYYIGIYSRLLWFKGYKEKTTEKPVSLIICARNEESNLKKNLPLILNQEYSDYEVIVVNDCSGDESYRVLADFKEEYSHLKVTTIHEDEKFSHGKKLALTLGIKAAKHDLLLMTDADCYPESKNWLRNMQANFTDETDIVLGYGGYLPQRGFVDKIIRFDTLFIALQYFSYTLAGFPYMGVGRNLAYRKKRFFENKGFASHMHIKSGDDDLFINKVATKANTRIELNPESSTISFPKKSFKEWRVQKKRHLTTGGKYQLSHKLLLGGEAISRFLFYLSFVYLIISNLLIYYILGCFVIRLLLQLIVFKITMKRLNERDLLLYSLLLDVLLPIFNVGFMVSNFTTNKKNKWK